MPLAFAVHLQPPRQPLPAADTAALDWFVLVTLGFLFFLLGCFAAWAWLIWRRSTRPPPHARLLMELAEAGEDEILHGSSPRPETGARAWEKPADWWKA